MTDIPVEYSYMSRGFKITIAILSLLSVSALVVNISWQYLDYADQPLIQARRLHRLDGKTLYRIVPTNSSENVAPFMYGIVQQSEPDIASALAWRRIGKSSVDIAKHLNQPLFIKGDYYLGVPKIIAPADLDEPNVSRHIHEQVDIRIDHVELLK